MGRVRKVTQTQTKDLRPLNNRCIVFNYKHRLWQMKCLIYSPQTKQMRWTLNLLSEAVTYHLCCCLSLHSIVSVIFREVCLTTVQHAARAHTHTQIQEAKDKGKDRGGAKGNRDDKNCESLTTTGNERNDRKSKGKNEGQLCHKTFIDYGDILAQRWRGSRLKHLDISQTSCHVMCALTQTHSG